MLATPTSPKRTRKVLPTRSPIARACSSSPAAARPGMISTQWRSTRPCCRPSSSEGSRRRGFRIIACRSVHRRPKGPARRHPARMAGRQDVGQRAGRLFPGQEKGWWIATIASGGLRTVPTEGLLGLHGSENLIVHELLHGYDYIRSHKPLKDKGFVAARNADFGKIGPYERQDGRAGSRKPSPQVKLVRHRARGQAGRPAQPPRLLVGDHSMGALRRSHPRLKAWQRRTISASRKELQGETAIGTAEYAGDGSILLTCAPRTHPARSVMPC